jgi:hypothetical protein
MTTVRLNATLVKERIHLLKDISFSVEKVMSCIHKKLRKEPIPLSGKGAVLLSLQIRLVESYKILYVQASHRIVLTHKLEEAIFSLLMIIESLKELL